MITHLVLIGCVCFAACVLSFRWVLAGDADASSHLPLNGQQSDLPGLVGFDDDVIMLFKNDELIDNTSNDGFAKDWYFLVEELRPRFGNLPISLNSVKAPLRFEDPETDARLTIERSGSRVRVFLGSNARPISENDGIPSPLSVTVVDRAPFPIWHSGLQGEVLWHNKAFEDLVQKLGMKDTSREPQFEDIHGGVLKGSGQRRMSVTLRNRDRKLWFDVVSVALRQGQLCYANDINAVVDAEIAQRNFVQTLAKTFAQLPIGLAIFDRNRRLALFNPALVDLMTIPAEFLSSRPDLQAFFDRLRDQNKMPEPKNYASWRDEIAELAEAAADGRYSETWTLPTGSVYSVSGRPHPDGAVAFLFEDITAEITLTRRFRSELELLQTALDYTDEAVVIFSADTRVALSNHAYEKLWNIPSDQPDSDVTIIEATHEWRRQSKPNPCWGDIRDFVTRRDGREDWWTSINMNDGRELTCHIQPVTGGATLVRFSQMQS